MTKRSGLHKLHLRAAVEGDSPRLAELSQQLGYPQSSAMLGEQLARIRANPDHAVFVASEEEERPVGWIHVYLRSLLQEEPYAEVGGLVVAESRRGSGVGTALLEEAERWAGDRGIGRVMLHCSVVRERAHRFYARNGYRVIKQSLVFGKGLETRRMP
jgi:GNAT superfamily N-acetyltransferase